MNHSQNSAHTVGPWFQAICIVITSSVLSLLVYINLQYFDALEKMPYVNTLPSVSSTPHMQGSLAEIQTGIFIRDISEFDVLKGKFVFNIVIWFLFDPTKVAQDVVSQFVFEKAKEDFRSEPIIRLDKEHERVIEYTVHLTASMSLNYRHFPVDDHRLNLVLANYALSPEHAVFATNPKLVITNPEIHVEGWHIIDTHAIAGHFINTINPYNPSQVFDHGRIVFSLDFERSGIRHMFSVILPMLVIFFATLFSFSISPTNSDYYNVIALSIASMMALIAYRFVIETVSPNTAYFMLSDYIFMYFLVATSVILFVNALGTHITSNHKRIVTVCLHLTTISVFTYFLSPWW